MRVKYNRFWYWVGRFYGRISGVEKNGVMYCDIPIIGVFMAVIAWLIFFGITLTGLGMILTDIPDLIRQLIK